MQAHLMKYLCHNTQSSAIAQNLSDVFAIYKCQVGNVTQANATDVASNLVVSNMANWRLQLKLQAWRFLTDH